MRLFKFILILLLLVATHGRSQKPVHIVTSDITHFWNAFDQITGTKDSARQLQLMRELFIDKGSPGLKAMMAARNYDAAAYVEAINRYPLFWRSVRQQTMGAATYAARIGKGIDALGRLYPGLRRAPVYFTVGVLRSNGTTLNGMVLIGSELALAGSQANSSEFPPALAHLRSFFDSDPARSVVFLNVHEYVHTQQKTTIAETLLAQCLIEGAAEFVAGLALKEASPTPALRYGAAHDAEVRTAFEAQLFNPYNGYWLYTNTANPFGVRDLGYYVGSAICARHYARAVDKRASIKAMIELDVTDTAAVASFVDASGYFDEPLASLRARYEAERPRVLSAVTTGDSLLTIRFSASMDPRYRNFELGPLGQEALLRIEGFRGFSADGTSAVFAVKLQRGRRYQLLVGDGFRSGKSVALLPFLIDLSVPE